MSMYKEQIGQTITRLETLDENGKPLDIWFQGDGDQLTDEFYAEEFLLDNPGCSVVEVTYTVTEVKPWTPEESECDEPSE